MDHDNPKFIGYYKGTTPLNNQSVVFSTAQVGFPNNASLRKSSQSPEPLVAPVSGFFMMYPAATRTQRADLGIFQSQPKHSMGGDHPKGATKAVPVS